MQLSVAGVISVQGDKVCQYGVSQPRQGKSLVFGVGVNDLLCARAHAYRNHRQISTAGAHHSARSRRALRTRARAAPWRSRACSRSRRTRPSWQPRTRQRRAPVRPRCPAQARAGTPPRHSGGSPAGRWRWRWQWVAAERLVVPSHDSASDSMLPAMRRCKPRVHRGT